MNKFNTGERMYLIPFGKTSKSYIAEPQEDNTADIQFKEWLDKIHERSEYHRKIKRRNEKF